LTLFILFFIIENNMSNLDLRDKKYVFIESRNDKKDTSILT